MGKITKLDTSNQIQFNRVVLDREIRLIKNKINEIIDAINAMNESTYADDFEDDELEEMSKAGDDGDYVFSPDEARRILASRHKGKTKRGDEK